MGCDNPDTGILPRKIDVVTRSVRICLHWPMPSSNKRQALKFCLTYAMAAAALTLVSHALLGLFIGNGSSRTDWSWDKRHFWRPRSVLVDGNYGAGRHVPSGRQNPFRLKRKLSAFFGMPKPGFGLCLPRPFSLRMPVLGMCDWPLDDARPTKTQRHFWLGV